MKKNLLETKSQILRKIVRWRRKAGNRQTSGSTDSSSFTESTTSNCQVPQQMFCIDDRYDDTGLATVSDYEEDNEVELDLSDLKNVQTDTQKPGYEDENCNDSVFELNISDNFSDSLIECFNTVLQPTA